MADLARAIQDGYKISNVIPKKHIIPNSMLTNSVMKAKNEDIIDISSKNKEDQKSLEITVTKGKKKEVPAKVFYALTYDSKNIDLNGHTLTEYDRAVADAVTSLYVYGGEDHTITPAMVYREMIHATGTETPSPKELENVTKSLEKMSYIRITADCSEELIQRELPLDDGLKIIGGEFTSYLLPLDRMTMRLRVDKKTRRQIGKKEAENTDREIEIIKVIAYKIIRPPILYEYNQLTDQVITVDAKLLDIRDKNGKKINNTERRIVIKSYLLRRIAIMKGKSGKHLSRHILYETITKECTVADEAGTTEWSNLSEKEQRHIRDYISQVLNYWTQCGFIKGYKELTHGRKRRGIEVLV